MPNVIIHNTTVTVYKGMLPYSREKEGNPHWKNFKDFLKFLGSIGFYVGEDKEIKKKFPTLNDDYRAGGFENLRYKAKYGPNNFEITFYQDIIYYNRYGGYYDFNKYEKMPYLIRKRYEWAMQKILAYFADCGFAIEDRNKPKDTSFILQMLGISSLEEIEGTETGEQTRMGRSIRNGDVVYTRGWDGYLRRGKVYGNARNGLQMLLPDGKIWTVSSYDLYDWDDIEVKGRKKYNHHPKDYVLRKEQLVLCSTKELERELRRRKHGKVRTNANSCGTTRTAGGCQN